MQIVGIVLGLFVFIFFVYKGYNRVLFAFLGAAVMLLFSGRSIIDGLNSDFMPAFANFAKSYGLIFVLSALFGKLIAEAGTAKSIALWVANKILLYDNVRLQRLLCLCFVPAIYLLFSYIGISTMVVVFTVMPIAKDLFQQTNTPWRLYCCAGAQTVNAAFIVGNLTISGITASSITGTSILAGVAPSLVLTISYTIVSFILLFIIVNRTIKKDEGFLPSGESISKVNFAEGISNDYLPSILISLTPFALVIIISVALKMDVCVALAAGCICTILIGWKNIKNKLKDVCAQGVTASYAPLLAVCATVGFGGVLKNLEAFSIINNLFASLPPLQNALCLGFFANFVTANATTASVSFGPQLIDLFTQAGLSAGTTNRMLCWLSCASMAPHNAGFANVEVVLKLSYKDALKQYMVLTFIPAFISLGLLILAIKLGIIV